MANIVLDHLDNECYVNVPYEYAEQIRSLKPNLFYDLADDCHIDLQLDSLLVNFSELSLHQNNLEEALNFLQEYNIPFLLRQNFTQEMYVEYLYLMNENSAFYVCVIESASLKIEPIRGRLTKYAKYAAELARISLPRASFINNVMRQQKALFKLTGTIETLTEFRYQSKKGS